MNDVEVAIVVHVTDPGSRKNILEPGQLVDGSDLSLSELERDQAVLHLGRDFPWITDPAIVFIDTDDGFIDSVIVDIVYYGGRETCTPNWIGKGNVPIFAIQEDLKRTGRVRPFAFTDEGEEIRHSITREVANGKAIAWLRVRDGSLPNQVEIISIQRDDLAAMRDCNHLRRAIAG